MKKLINLMSQFGASFFPKNKSTTSSFSLKKHPEWVNNIDSIDVNCKNLETIMQDLSWQYVDIIKADIEGMWWEFCNELLNKNIDFKILITEFELNFVKGYRRSPRSGTARGT